MNLGEFTFKPGTLKLELCRTNKKKIANIVDFSNASANLNHAAINDLTFNIPLKARYGDEIKPNHVAQLIREWYLIKATFINRTEYYVIDSVTDSSTQEKSEIQVTCQLSPYMLNKPKIRQYEGISKNLQEIGEVCLKGTGWTIGEIESTLNEKRRSFTIGSITSRFDFLRNICETFDAVPVFDTINDKVSFFEKDSISKYKGVKISSHNFMIDMSDTRSMDEVVTRLHVTGKDGIVINSVNPTGQGYLDDFSFFLSPFQRDEKRNVLKRSAYMSNELCNALLDYNELVDKESKEFKTMLDDKKKIEAKKSAQENELFVLKNLELQQILDRIEVVKETDGDTKDLIKQRDAKQKEVESKKNEIDKTISEISTLNSQIEQLRKRLDMSNFLGEDMSNELSKFILEDEWTNDNIFDETELYEKSYEELEKRKSPPIDIKTNIVNLYNAVSEKDYWDRISLGDIVRIQNKEFGTEYRATLAGMSLNFDDSSISITITNGKKAKEEDDFIQLFYKADKASTEFNTRKIDYDTLATNYNARNDRISIPPSPPTIGAKSITHTVNENGSVDISVSWDYPTSDEDKYNIGGFIVHCYPDTSSDTYLFGASLAKEQRISVRYNKRIATFTSQVPTKYFTFGVQSYRNVETSISSNGVLLSDIVQPQAPYENPYRPSSTVEVKGKVNGLYQISTTEKPSNPDVGTLWIDPANNKSELYDGEQWIVQSAGSADSLNGITTAAHEAPNTIPVRDDNGVISASISGNAMKLGGLEATEYALKSDVLNKVNYMSGEYIGNGTIARQINLSFTPKTVKIYSTSIEDSSLHITLNSFGYINQLTNGNLVLVGGTDAYGSIGINLFKTGSDQALRGNKPNVKYLWDAWG
ncbi:phage tail protein [Bacillus altitudinis]|uniref:Phage tail protein n=2 Tax=Bacillus altitudinis TaxID=293387 RepID=A0ABV1SAE4_BACAB